MNNTNNIINDFLNSKIDYSSFEQALISDLLKGAPLAQVENNIRDSKLDSILSDDQISLLIQTLQNSLSDKTIIATSGPVHHFASETVAPDEDNDKTVLSNTTQIQENTAEDNDNDNDNDNDKTVLAAGVGHNAINTNIAADIESNAGSDATIIDDQTRIATPFASKTSQVDLPESSFNTTNSAQTAISSQIPQSSGQQPGKKLEPGAIINNRFVLEKLLGRGGMGSVFKARDLRKEEANDSNSHIAIKFLNEDFKQHPQALISLQRESKKSQTLAHPNIITVHDFDRDGDTVYMTMEYLDGAPLDEFLVNHKHTGIEKDVAIKIIDDISQALAYAHKNNIVHSDFKPGNVFITTDGTAKILDFGIARAVQNIGDIDDTGEKKSSAGAEKTVFDAGELGGLTPTYASCEMLEGKQPSASDDIYALGCVAYELLTGAHPFSRVTATRARDSNLAPEIIKSLDRKQSNALVHTLQFSKDARTEDAQEFIREFFIRKQNSKILIATLSVAALLLIGIGIKYFLDYRQQIAIENLIAEVQQGKTEVIENAIPDLRALEGETRETVLSDVRPVVIQYYAKKALPLADQSKGLYNFPAALAVLSDAKKLYPDSAQVNELIIQITNNQNQLLNTLGLQIDKFLQKGKLSSAIYNNDIQDIIDLLKIAAPDSHLLKDTRIQLAYIREIKAALKTDNLDDAKILIKSGLSLFNNDKEILALKENLKEREAQIIEDQQLASLQEQLSKEGKKITEPVRKKAIERQVEKLNGLLKTGFQDSTWLNEVQSTIVTLDVFAKKPEEKQLPLRDRAATLIIQQSREKRRAGEIAEARSLLKHAYKIAPALTALAREERALTVAERKQQQSHSNKEKTAQITSLRQTLLNQTKSDDVKNATQTYKKLKSLDPQSRFVKIEATEAIANAYLRLAKGLAERSKFDSAVKLTESGISIAPGYIAAKEKRNEYKAEIAILELNEALKNVDTINIDKSRRQLKIIRLGLPQRYESISNSASSQLLSRIKELATSDQDKAKMLIDVAQKIFPDSKEITALTKRSSKFQSAGGQPCKKSYAGHGKRTRATCFDMLADDIKAPLMVVIPPVNKNSTAFSISKYEVSIEEYNQYCELSTECKQFKNIDTALPVTNLSKTDIDRYLKWISTKTAQKYRLPTDTEWRHAANADGNQPKKDVNCRLMLGNKQIKGNDLLDAKSGKQNGWGLKNHIGNAQELVTNDSKYYARGGAHTDSFSQCDIDLKRVHNGSGDSVTGFRVVKEL